MCSIYIESEAVDIYTQYIYDQYIRYIFNIHVFNVYIESEVMDIYVHYICVIYIY